jgi:hypothetical protein
LKHFYEHGDKYYSQFRRAGYPRGDFVAEWCESGNVPSW